MKQFKADDTTDGALEQTGRPARTETHGVAEFFGVGEAPRRGIGRFSSPEFFKIPWCIEVGRKQDKQIGHVSSSDRVPWRGIADGVGPSGLVAGPAAGQIMMTAAR